MLSILIPTYNYNINPLVEELYNQANACDIKFEIIIVDDASSQIKYNSQELWSSKNISLKVLNENIGRSAIRNLLASLSSYENLLFVDAGTFPKPKQFINNYLEVLEGDVVIGGMIQNKTKPKKPYTLRWLYTKERESVLNKNISTSANFLIKKSIILSNPFDETIKTYGYEDLLFFKTLESNGITLQFINNPVVHDCDEDARTFIKKTEDALKNLHNFSLSHSNLLIDNKILRTYNLLNRLFLDRIFGMLIKITRPLLLKNLCSSRPSLFVFDLYKLGYFCNLKQKN
ncbi:MAG: glycosyltransferase family 2 protein [Winogradskyella sp.]|jgi:glycosyltransferase involved in cell wall biosynthesis